MIIDTDKLRADLMDEYGTAAFNGFPAAIIDLSEIENMSDQDLVEMAYEKGISLERYAEDDS